ncbi:MULTISPECIES: peptidoglycan-associated lipoprotein Pal [Idiomarinaceae]|uniref:Peptidoglycan-associated lipoprotein n=3 Tax=Pseudidiomarina TaxID=2800384 RepID=A0A368V627_9GAMM|nr:MULTISPECIES: peptidoglycan-associated lipoprotein Pal [Idiomarinaceae]MRJ41212.1 peptidoglycan-associated lipoprotein Pal [Idiomarina sp. FeN1]NCU56377.1 peptidoglycan-associated lipoprotein Pal [Idiomarina sp. FenA--70]NCU59396.1 peptidoglycan-associated lipoprotein Pal [Idiomarina sp. FenBw--71]PWW16170.1 peptidoglycan-associated lipoprotein [Pseudidiomarina maritima]RBP93320.1 peptidoglycan-associated lipoprotein [Pseudidiomarina tainanensis]
MNANKALKSLFIAVPMLALAACSSNQAAEEAVDQQTNQQQQGQGSGSGVDVGGIERPKTPEEIRAEKVAELRQANTVFFAFDDSRISSEYAQVLAAHADFLVQNPAVSVTVEGHCDERGTPEYNIALGERRAKAVAQYLQNLGVSSSQINTVSYGEEKPLIKASNDDAYAKNRRGVLVY